MNIMSSVSTESTLARSIKHVLNGGKFEQGADHRQDNMGRTVFYSIITGLIYQAFAILARINPKVIELQRNKLAVAKAIIEMPLTGLAQQVNKARNVSFKDQSESVVATFDIGIPCKNQAENYWQLIVVNTQNNKTKKLDLPEGKTIHDVKKAFLRAYLEAGGDVNDLDLSKMTDFKSVDLKGVTLNQTNFEAVVRGKGSLRGVIVNTDLNKVENFVGQAEEKNNKVQIGGDVPGKNQAQRKTTGAASSLLGAEDDDNTSLFSAAPLSNNVTGDKFPRAGKLDLDHVKLDRAWLEFFANRGINLQGADLSEQKDLQKVMLAQKNLAKANFSGADLTGANLRGAILKGTDFSNANVKGVDFTGANLSEAVANTSTVWQGSTLDGVGGLDVALFNLLGKSKLKLGVGNLETLLKAGHKDFTNIELISGNPLGPDLSKNKRLDNSDFTDASLVKTDFSGADLSKAKFTNANLSGIKVNQHTKLENTDFTGANLTGADLKSASNKVDTIRLTNARLYGAKLNSQWLDKAIQDGVTNFTNVDLGGQDLTGLIFQNLNFTGANFEGCKLDGVDLSTCNLANARLKGATFSNTSLNRSGFLAAAHSRRVTSEAVSDTTNPQTRIDLRGIVCTGTEANPLVLSSARDRLDLQKADLTGSTFTYCDYSYVNANDARFVAAEFNQCRLDHADLRNARFGWANLHTTSLAYANVEGARVSDRDYRDHAQQHIEKLKSLFGQPGSYNLQSTDQLTDKDGSVLRNKVLFVPTEATLAFGNSAADGGPEALLHVVQNERAPTLAFAPGITAVESPNSAIEKLTQDKDDGGLLNSQKCLFHWARAALSLDNTWITLKNERNPSPGLSVAGAISSDQAKARLYDVRNASTEVQKALREQVVDVIVQAKKHTTNRLGFWDITETQINTVKTLFINTDYVWVNPVTAAAPTPTPRKGMAYFDSQKLTMTAAGLEKKSPALRTGTDKRVLALHDTAKTLADTEKFERTIYSHAVENHHNWSKQAAQNPQLKQPCKIEVKAGDWGDVALRMSKTHGGQIYVVLNMANENYPGGAFEDGAPAQEENMFRRTDCATTGRRTEFRTENGAVARSYNGRLVYSGATTALIGGEQGQVYLDMEHPRVCFKASEANQYQMLREDAYFLFYEMRSAALDLRQPENFQLSKEEQKEKLQKRIAAQLDTAMAFGQRHLVLSAFGCGAFENDPGVVSRLYKEEIEKRKEHFDHIVFAIFTGSGVADDREYMKKSATNLGTFQKTFAIQEIDDESIEEIRELGENTNAATPVVRKDHLTRDRAIPTQNLDFEKVTTVSAPTKPLSHSHSSADQSKFADHVKAQTSAVLSRVKAELGAGNKTTHWIWYIFPQLAGFGSSDNSRLYALASLDEAKQYLQHQVLGQRLREHTELINKLSDKTAEQVFNGEPDVSKFHACMTLFAAADDSVDSPFQAALNKYFGGKTHAGTTSKLNSH